MTFKRLLITFLISFNILIIVSFPLFSQTTKDNDEPKAILSYFDNSGELEVFNSDGVFIGEISQGMDLYVGATVKTYNSTAEMKLVPNGSIIKLSENSIFQIEFLQTSADESNDFSLYKGKLRLVAATSGTGYEKYSIITQSSVCGVIGTDFTIDSMGVLAVKDGTVAFTSILNSKTISVSKNEISDVFADTFQASPVSDQAIASLFNGMDFYELSPHSVPRFVEKSAEDAEEIADSTETEEISTVEEVLDDSEEDSLVSSNTEEEALSNTETVVVEDQEKVSEPISTVFKQDKKQAITGSAAGILFGRNLPEAPEDNALNNIRKRRAAKAEERAKDGEDSKSFWEAFGESMSLDIGALSVNSITYAKILLQPKVEVGKFRAQFYIPIIFNENPFDLENWYFPSENNEWSFGSDQSSGSDIALDLAHDLFLKVKYLEFGDYGDTFFVKLGNIENMTMGYGILMRNFTNNIEFPAVRKIGVNTGFNFNHIGWEGVVDDASDPSILGTRFVYYPLGKNVRKVNLGLSFMADINPDSETESSTTFFDPMIISSAVDLGIPFDLIGMTVFAQAGGLAIYKDGQVVLNNILLSGVTNFGVSGGILGKLFFLDYRLEYRLSKGIFTSAYFGNSYLTYKQSRYDEILDYISDTSNEEYHKTTMGVYGELSGNIFDAIKLSGSYLWPWIVDNGAISSTDKDNIMLSAELMPDVLPVIGLYGKLSYIRTGLFNSFQNAANGTETFEAASPSTIVKAEAILPINDSVDIAFQLSTTYSRDSDGNLLDSDDDGFADTGYAFTLDMRIHF
ncbi:MAG: FecR domain-containing protein [Spirochaetales bacterium]|nr:FecR domain-containing protein [Spirochaetales bacterium]